MNAKTRLAGLISLALAASPALAGNVYQCRAADGKISFQDTPCKNAADLESRRPMEDFAMPVPSYPHRPPISAPIPTLPKRSGTAGLGSRPPLRERSAPGYLPGTGVAPKRYDPEGRRLRLDRREEREFLEDLYRNRGYAPWPPYGYRR